MQLVPCTQCRRHVDARASTCPFCGSRVAEKPQLAAPRGKLTRAAVFSAALVGCNAKHEPPKAAPAPAQQQGSDDLEKMLDGDHHVDRPAPADGAVAMQPDDAGVAASVPADAGNPVDIAVPTRGHGHIRVHKEGPPPPPPPPPDDQVVNPNWHNIPKPYGAPPARRRLV